MTTMNPFDLLGADDAEDPSLLTAAQKQVGAAASVPTKKGPAQRQAKQPAPVSAAKLPSKPLPPSQAVREGRNEGGRGGGRGGRGGYGRGGRGGYNRDSNRNENSFGNAGAPASQGATDDGDSGKPSERRGGRGGPRGGYRGGRRGDFDNGEVGEGDRPRRAFERHSGTGRGNEMKREGAGRGNWGTQTDEFAQLTEEVVNEAEKNLGDEKPLEESAGDENKESPDKPEEKEPEDKEMTLEEYQKVLEEKRKALQALKTEERKVDPKEFQSMQQLSSKKDSDDIFVKLGSNKDKRKDASEKDERAKKSVSINEFLKPADGDRYYGSGGRGRGRGRGSRGFGNRDGMSSVSAPSIEDPGQFPTLGGK